MLRITGRIGIKAAAQAAWSTDRGQPIAAAVVTALRTSRIILPTAGVIERTAIAGRARARTRATHALMTGISERQIAKLDELRWPPETGQVVKIDSRP